ncbi:MAG: hypothetical protein MZW92_42795 [Comamonadaceae bacterium]|nr:hypothetical protein [Comamonadaceae bacterium]
MEPLNNITSMRRTILPSTVSRLIKRWRDRNSTAAAATATATTTTTATAATTAATATSGTATAEPAPAAPRARGGRRARALTGLGRGLLLGPGLCLLARLNLLRLGRLLGL